MQACVDVSFPYAHVRDAFGKKIGEHQVILSNAWSTAATVCFCIILISIRTQSSKASLVCKGTGTNITLVHGLNIIFGQLLVMLTGITYKFRFWSRSWPVIFTKPQIEIIRWIYSCKRLKCFMTELFLWFKESMWINPFSQVFIWKPCTLDQSRWPASQMKVCPDL